MDDKPLLNKKVLITRPKGQSGHFIKRLKELGAIPVELPTIELIPPVSYDEIDEQIKNIEKYDWLIFTSYNGANYFIERIKQMGLSPDILSPIKKAAVGTATAEVLNKCRIKIDLLPKQFVGENIAEVIGEVNNLSILIPTTNIAGKELASKLEQKGASVTQLVVYQTVKASIAPETISKILANGIDFLTFTSSSTVRAFYQLIENKGIDINNIKIACIGPKTAETAKKLGMQVTLIAQPHTVDGLIEEMTKMPKI